MHAAMTAFALSLFNSLLSLGERDFSHRVLIQLCCPVGSLVKGFAQPPLSRRAESQPSAQLEHVYYGPIIWGRSTRQGYCLYLLNSQVLHFIIRILQLVADLREHAEGEAGFLAGGDDFAHVLGFAGDEVFE